MAKQAASTETAAADDYVQFWPAGARAKGAFNCSECGHAATVYTELPVCPTCASTSWEQVDWSPFARAAAFSDL